MIELCYVSSANDKFTAKELIPLLQQARQFNENSGISGLLLYDGIGTFIQALEGEEAPVRALFDKIKIDSRHKRVNVLGINFIKERSFREWSMGFRNIEHPDLSKLTGFSDFLEQSPEKRIQLEEAGDGFALRMLDYFRGASVSESQNGHNI